MTRTAKTLIHWLVRDHATNGSPRGTRFSLPARFDHQVEDWKSNAWSLIVDVKGRVNAEGYQMASVRFLVPEAPHDWLSEGRRFTLFEGSLAVAEGEVKEIQAT